jgi:hypothetical protein
VCTYSPSTGFTCLLLPSQLPAICGPGALPEVLNTALTAISRLLMMIAEYRGQTRFGCRLMMDHLILQS